MKNYFNVAEILCGISFIVFFSQIAGCSKDKTPTPADPGLTFHIGDSRIISLPGDGGQINVTFTLKSINDNRATTEACQNGYFLGGYGKVRANFSIKKENVAALDTISFTRPGCMGGDLTVSDLIANKLVNSYQGIKIGMENVTANTITNPQPLVYSVTLVVIP